MLFTFIKKPLLVLLTAMFLCGCSKPPVPVSAASRLIEPGKDIVWSDNTILHVTNRMDSLLEGVRVIRTDANGQVTTITAEKATLDPYPGTLLSNGIAVPANTVSISLKDAQLRSATTNQIVKELTLILHR